MIMSTLQNNSALQQQQQQQPSNNLRMSQEGGSSLGVSKVNLVENNDKMRQLVEKWANSRVEITEIGKFLQSIGSTDLESQYYGVIGLRKLVSMGIFIFDNSLILARK